MVVANCDIFCNFIVKKLVEYYKNLYICNLKYIYNENNDITTRYSLGRYEV
jgi:hypothetical protein